MVVGYELGKTLGEVSELSREEIGYWLAFIKLKQKREAEALRKSRPPR
jgi:hypothetical protein